MTMGIKHNNTEFKKCTITILFFNLFSPYFLDWIISVALPSSSLTLLYIMSILLLILSSILFNFKFCDVLLF